MTRLPRLTMLFISLAPFAACAAPATGHSDAAAPVATKAAIVFGSCPQKPIWPEAALQEKRQGAVVLVFEVDADNTVLDARVKDSSGHPDLDEAARTGLAKVQVQGRNATWRSGARLGAVDLQVDARLAALPSLRNARHFRTGQLPPDGGQV